MRTSLSLSKTYCERLPFMRFFGSPRFARVRVAGPSMSPTYRDGDILLVRWFDELPRSLPLTTVVVIERDLMPGVHFIKRIQKSHGEAYWVEGDNRDSEVESRMHDSRSWGYIGAHEIKGKVLFRLKRG
ncbi:MAG: S26 family signal peptidase [Actinobacteria bacterium]|nr:S26 family signal peptidase [Actinomycetota bacterium]